MLEAAIIQIAGLAIGFFICSLLCYCLCTYLLREEGKDDNKPPIEAWEVKHYYDPLPTALSPEGLSQPTVYSFKIQNGTNPYVPPHAVINPAVLQFPPGHVHEEREISLSSFGFQAKGGRSSSKISPKSEKLLIENQPINQSKISFKEEKAMVVGNGRIGKGRAWIP